MTEPSNLCSICGSVLEYGEFHCPACDIHHEPMLSPTPRSGTLDSLLDEFKLAMRAKFWARHEKQHARGNKSVCDPDFRFPEDLDRKRIADHFAEEVNERFQLSVTDREKALEDIDVANLAFLDWVARGKGRQK